MPPTVPINHVLQSAPPTKRNRSPALSFHAQPCRERKAPAWNTLICSQEHARAENAFAPWEERLQHMRSGGVQEGRPEGVIDRDSKSWSAPQQGCPRQSDYELFKCNNFNIRYWSWCYRGCWHQTCPPIVTRCGFCIQPHSRLQT